jgi:hypothetical protein
MAEYAGISPALKSALSQAGQNPPVDPGIGATPKIGPLPKPENPSPPPSLAPIKMVPDSPIPTLTPSAPNVSPMKLGTTQGDTLHRQQILGKGPAVDNIYHNITGSDFGQNHPVLGKILGVAGEVGGKIGDTLSNAFPGIGREIPGTTQNYNQQLGRANTALTQDETNAKDEAQTANLNASAGKTNAETPEVQPEAEARIGLQKVQTDETKTETNEKNDSLQNPSIIVGHAHAVDKAIREGRDPSQDPIVQAYENRIIALQPKQNLPAQAPKTIQVEKNGKPHQMAWNPATGKYDLDQGESGEKPPTVNVNAGTAALDRETKQFGSPHQKSIDAASAQLEKIEDARNMINGNAESQALGVPKVLTALVGGQGTGVRITTPELNAIAKARGLSGDVEGTLNKWAGQGALTKTQQQQLTSILNDVQQRILQKQAIAKDALDSINGASTREQIIQADKAARQKLIEMEKGGGTINSSANGKNNDPLGVR